MEIPGGYDKRRKSKCLIFMKFHVPPKSWKLEKNEAPDIFEVLCTEIGQKWNDWFIYLARAIKLKTQQFP